MFQIQGGMYLNVWDKRQQGKIYVMSTAVDSSIKAEESVKSTSQI